MITRSPCHYYTKYLISLPERLTDDAIKNRLQRKNLIFLDSAYMAELRASIVPPREYMPRVRAHKSSFNFLKQHRIASMYFPDEDMRAALGILDNPNAKEMLEANLIIGMPVHLSIAQLSQMYGVVLTQRSVEKYKHYFFNTSLLARQDLRELVSSVQHSDLKKLALDLPSTPAAALLVQMRAGVFPKGFDAYKLIKNTFELAALRTAESVITAGYKSSLTALQYAQTTDILSKILESMARPDQDVRNDLAMLKMRTMSKDAEPPNIQQLSGGNYSADYATVNTEEVARGNGDEQDD